MRIRLHIFLICIVVVSAGCGEWKRPEWMGGKPESPVIAPTEITPTSQPGDKSDPAPVPLGSPADKAPDSTSPEVPTLSQADPDLMTMQRAQRQKQLVDLSSPKRMGDDSLAPVTAPPKTLSEKIKPKPPRVEQEPASREPIFDEPEETTPPAEPATPPGKEPKDVKSYLLADRTAPVPTVETPTVETPTVETAKATPREKPPTLDKAKPKSIVLNKEEVVAGATLQVNDTQLTVDELLSGLHRDLSEIPAHVEGQAFRHRVAKLLSNELMYQIQQTLVFAEANRLLEEGPKAYIDKEMEETLRKMIAEAGGSREQLRQKCIQEGTTLDDMLQSHRRSLTVQAYLQSKFYPAIVINRRMLWDYYRRHKDEFSSEKQVQMQIIALPFKEFLRRVDEREFENRQPTQAELDAAKALAGKRMKKAMAELKTGADFTETVKKFSMGLKRTHDGVWPMMGRGNFREKEVENAAFKLKVGRHSGIIETKEGYYIVKAKTVEPGKVVSFEDAQEEIAEKLRRKQFMDLRLEYMRKIYQKATIGDPEAFLKLAVERAVEKYRQ